MQTPVEAVQEIIHIKYLFGAIAFLVSCQVAFLVYFAKKYIKKIEYLDQVVSKLVTEHKVFHREKTGINI